MTVAVETLMLIDDNRVDQMIYRRIIDRSGLVGNTLAYTDPEEALTYLTGAKGIFPDLILLDINMPRMDGFEFLDAATEALGEAFATVVVMLTTSMDPTDEARAATYGAVRSYVNKPLDHKKLTQVVSLV